jgi:tetratricopeptide (TPR) repeat protein
MQDPSPDTELESHLSIVREQVSGKFLDLSRREDLVLDMAGTLDRAAQAATSAEKRRLRWSQAIELFDRFLKENVEPPRAREMRFQAGVYRWAQAQSWIQAGEGSPGDPQPRKEAVTALDDAIERFRSVGTTTDRQTLADNLRFRLAESLADRASLEPADAPGRRSRESEAIDLLAQPPGETGLAGFWFLLKADLLRRLGKPAEAETQLEAAVKAKPAPPQSEITEVRLPLFLEGRKFTEAIDFLKTVQLDPPARELWTVRTRLAQVTGIALGADRIAAEKDLFRAAGELRKSPSPESRAAFLELASSRLSPDASHPPEVWETLATAYGAAGDPSTAGAQMTIAANRAAALGQTDTAASYRLKAGGFLFQAGNFAEADTVLSQIADSAGPEPLRAKAGMLRAVVRGRAVAVGSPGASTARYIAALERQLRDFPTNPSSDEARWLLGKAAVANSQRERAEELWSAIEPASPHWLESRLAVLNLDRDQLSVEDLSPDRKRMADTFNRARKFAILTFKQARTESDKIELLLERARLELAPIVGAPDSARDLCDQIAGRPCTPSQAYRARLLRLIAQVQLTRYIEAEREAQSHHSWRIPTELNAYFDALRLLDQCASTADTDLHQRRFGLVLRLLVEPVLKGDEDMPPEMRSEVAFRETRALLFTGADRDARVSIAAWKDLDSFTSSDRLLRELGDTYSRLEIYSHAIDVERLRMKNSSPGSLPWFDARYALALAYFHTGKLREAAQLIDSTSILRPELGGTVLHDKFIRLRRRLGVKP